jgi:hypothetical protein
MPHNVSMIGLHPEELRWVRMLVSLLRHPDPAVGELTRQALLYLSRPGGSQSPLATESRPRSS